jgi:uncharacterized membrane protein YphA (DoxX/SURF4 family)
MKLSKFDSWIFDSYQFSPDALALYRIFYALFAIFIIIPGHPPYGYYGFLNGLPGDFFLPPPGPMMFFGTFPPGWVFVLIEGALIVSLISLLIGWKTSFSSIIVAICFLVGNGFSYSLGKINHDLFLPLIPLVMLFSNWGSAWSIDGLIRQQFGNPKHPKEDVQNWPITLLTLFLGFMMFTAGFPKILGGWLDPGKFATYGHLLNQHFVNSRTALLSEFFINLNVPIFWTLIDYFTIIFEIGFLFAIIKPKLVRLFCALAIIFHFGVMMMLNISFLPNLTIYSLFLFNWNLIANNLGIQKHFNSAFNTESTVLKRFRFKALTVRVNIVAIVIIISFILLFIGSPLNLFNKIIDFDSDLLFLEVVILSIYLPIALLGILSNFPKKRFHKTYFDYFG